MIKFYIGKSSTGKTKKILKDIKNEINSNSKSKLLYIVPEQYNLQAEKDLIETTGLDGFIDVDILSFKWFTKKVIDSVGGLKQVEVDNLGKSMIIRDILHNEKSNLKFYKRGTNNIGFINRFMDLFEDFKKNNINQEILDEVYKNSEGDTYLNYKIHDIKYIFEKYNDYLGNDYFDQEDKFDYIISKIDETNNLDDVKIWIDRFSGFNTQQLKLIEKFFKNAKDVTVSFTLDPEFEDNSVFNNVRKSYVNLQDLAEELKLDFEFEVFDKYLGNNNIKFLSDNIYKYPNDVNEDVVNNIKIFTGSNLYEEIELIAIEIMHLIREKNYNWNDIAVVTNNFDNYLIPVKSVFSDYNIPYFIDQKKKIDNNPIIIFITTLLKMFERNFRYEDVFSHIKTGFTNLTKDEYETLENYVLEYDIKRNMWFSDFTRGSNKIDESELAVINEIREKFITNYEKFYTEIDRKDINVSKFTKKLYHFLEENNLNEKLNIWIDRLRKESHLEEVNENTQIWNVVMNIFDQLVEIFDHKKITLKEYIDVLEEGFSQYEIGILPCLDDEVLVGDLSRSKSHSIKALFIIGVNDGAIPSQISDNEIFSQEENEFLMNNKIDIKIDNEFKMTENNYIIYSAISKPDERLYFSYSLSDNEGKSLRESILIERIKQIFPNIDHESSLNLSNDFDRCIVTPDSSMKFLIENLRKKIDGFEIDDKWYSIYHWYHNNYNESVQEVIRGLFHDNQVNSIGKKRAKDIYELPLKSSPTRIDSYVKCPFKHFVNYGIKPKQRGNYDIELMDLGLIYHRSIEKFSRELKERELDWSLLDKHTVDILTEDIIKELTEDYNDELFNNNYRNKYFKKKINRVISKSIWTLKEHIDKGEFNPRAFEVKFSEKEGIRPIVINLNDNEKFILEGRIDRIDVLEEKDESFIKVIDYKSGSSNFKLSDVYNGLDIQLIVYLSAILENSKQFGFKNLKPAGIFYFKIDDPIIDYSDNKDIEQKIFEEMKMQGVVIEDMKIISSIDSDIIDNKKSDVINVSKKKNGDFSKRSSIIDNEDFYLLINHVKEFVKGVGNEILEGKTDIKPINDVCGYCDYRGICQFDTLLDNNEYRLLNNYRDKEVIELLKKESDKDEMDG